MSKISLTTGSLEAIIAGTHCENPVVQVLGVKKIQNQSNSAQDRYRLLLSDGENSLSSVMLATQLNKMVEDKSLDVNCVICLQRYLTNTIQADKKVVVLLELEVLKSGSQVGSKIGDPSALKQPLEKSAPQASKQQNSTTDTSSNAKIPSSSSSSSSMNKKADEQAAHGRIYPIASLTPYLGKTTIKARVSLKNKIHTWSNEKGEGQLFSFNLVDNSGEIKVTAFKKEVERFYNMIEANKVYLIKNGNLRAANKKFSSVDNDYEMTLASNSEVIPVSDEDEGELPTVQYNFVQIDQIQNIEPNTFIDVIGVVKEVEEVRSLTQRSTSKELRKREVHLVDQSGSCIGLTLWGQDADDFEGSDHPVVALKACKVSNWNGRSLSQTNNTLLVLNPPLPEANVLRGWYDKAGCTHTFREYKREGGAASEGGTKWLGLAEVGVQVEAGADDKPEYFQCKATIVSIKAENCLYMACPQPECNKKVVDLGNSVYRCEKCAQEFTSFKWRFILQVNVCDYGGSLWQTCFQEAAEQVLQRSAQEMGQLKIEDQPSFEKAISEASFNSFVFKCRSKMEKYNDENRLKTVCLQATPVDHVELSRRLLKEMTSILGPV